MILPINLLRYTVDLSLPNTHTHSLSLSVSLNMDFLKKAASSMGNKDEKKQDGNQQQGGDQNQPKDDYVDKGKLSLTS